MLDELLPQLSSNQFDEDSIEDKGNNLSAKVFGRNIRDGLLTTMVDASWQMHLL